MKARGQCQEERGEICETTLRPDLVLWTVESRTVIIVELTVPWELNIQAAYERKKGKYQDLVMDCVSRGWKFRQTRMSWTMEQHKADLLKLEEYICSLPSCLSLLAVEHRWTVLRFKTVYDYTGIYLGDQPHGNSKDPESVYVLCREETMLKIHRVCSLKDQLPLEEQPSNINQVKTKFREARKRRGAVPSGGQNVADHVQQLEAPDGHPFARQVIRGYNKETAFILYTDEQIQDLKRFCCSSAHAENTVFSVDKTFNLGQFHVIIFNLKHLGVVKRDTDYGTFFDHIRSKLDELPVVGSDNERGLRVAIAKAWPGFHQLYCHRHIRNDFATEEMVCKILKGEISDAVVEHIKSNNLVCPEQHGFSEGSTAVSPEHAAPALLADQKHVSPETKGAVELQKAGRPGSITPKSRYAPSIENSADPSLKKPITSGRNAVRDRMGMGSPQTIKPGPQQKLRVKGGTTQAFPCQVMARKRALLGATTFYGLRCDETTYQQDESNGNANKAQIQLLVAGHPLYRKPVAISCWPGWRSGDFGNSFKTNLEELFRPIALLPTVAKVLERLVHNHFYSHLTENNLLNVNLSRFRKGEGTVLQLLRLVDDWAKSIEDLNIPCTAAVP
ncbi:hypothetical protein Bbelb_192910 [Branchiostoma belcheri]|nr:hypothetical protein Bbelb_192910 [Branchiostoma belcheri]